MPRDIIAEIEAARSRSEIAGHYVTVFSLGVLKARVKDVADASEVLGYFPVATVAHLEAFFSRALRALLDMGDPFLGRCNQLLKDARVTLDSSLAVALAGRRVTFGEVIAASLGYSDLIRSSAYMSILLGSDFLAAVRTQYNTTPDQASGTFDDAMAQLKSLYETRHIIAHEVRPELILSRESVLKWIEAAFSFLYAAVAVMEEAMFPGGLPKTQAELNQLASEQARKEISDLENTVTRLGELASDHKPAIDSLLADWLAWARKASDLTAEILVGSGTIYPLVQAKEIERLAESEHERLQLLVNRLTGEGSV